MNALDIAMILILIIFVIAIIKAFLEQRQEKYNA